MKHNILVAGVPRAGKSTLSRMVAEACGYQLLCMDAVIAGFERHFPETGVDTYADLPSDTILRHVSGKIAPFLQTVMERGAYDAHGRGMVIDVYQLLPEDFVRCMRPELCDAYYLVSADVTPEERFALLKAFDTPQDYTFFQSDEQLMEGCGYMVEQSRLIRDQCRALHLPCYETTRNRTQVLRQILEEIAQKSRERTQNG